MQKYKVFYNSKFLLLSNHKISCEDCKISFLFSKETLDEFLDEENFRNFQIITDNPKETFYRMMQEFRYIEAAGGLVENDKNEILLIYRLKHWDLPKGKIEKDELPYESAKREVEEECGISVDTVEKQVASTFHIYKMNNIFYLKKTFWYPMKYTGTEKLVPQSEEDIEKAVWVKKSEIQKYLDYMFLGIRELFL